MEFIENIFVDKKIENVQVVLNSLKKCTPVFNVYLICISLAKKQTATIVSSYNFFKNKAEYEDYKIVGIASGKYGANRLFVEILQYWLEKGTPFSLFKSGIVEE